MVADEIGTVRFTIVITCIKLALEFILSLQICGFAVISDANNVKSLSKEFS